MSQGQFQNDFINGTSQTWKYILSNDLFGFLQQLIGEGRYLEIQEVKVSSHNKTRIEISVSGCVFEMIFGVD